MPDLIYIIGSGRSGSTVVERILNSADEVVAVGEVHALWRLPVETLRCSCGKLVPDCPFWCEALRAAGIGPDQLAELAELEHRVIRNSHLVKLRFDPARIVQDPDIARFLALQKHLFDGIRQASGARVVVDSSKAGPRARVLQAGLEPVFLHTYREAEAVMASWRSRKHDPGTNALMKRPPLSEAAIDWIKAEHTARALSRRTTVVRVDHTAFSHAPRRTLSAALDPHMPGLVDAVAWTSENSVRPAEAYHSVLGNPDRFNSGDIVIEPRGSRRDRPSARERFLIRSVGRVLNRLYP
ncbi:MAG: hypothetical protein AAGA05_11740 [Pseudomonadota bacterium]